MIQAKASSKILFLEWFTGEIESRDINLQMQISLSVAGETEPHLETAVFVLM